VSDRVLSDALYLDAIGLLPCRRSLDEFLADKRSDKRDRLVKRLLADNAVRRALADLLERRVAQRLSAAPVTLTAGASKSPTALLRAGNEHALQRIRAGVDRSAAAVRRFQQRDRLARRGQREPDATDAAAQNISQVFMGVNLKCASCHDSFINDWMLSDSYGLAGIFSDQPLEMVHCDKPTGQIAKPKFIYPELGDIDPKAENRRG